MLGRLLSVLAIRSGNRHRSVSAVGSKEKEINPGFVANCEMDTHADTCVAGPNFRIDELTGEHCDVAPYSSDYEPIKDVPIVNASTAFTDEETGETMILQFNQVLWYGKRLSMSLINPNQIRHAGLVVSDDPTDKTRDFGIVGDHCYIPFEMSGTTVLFKSRVPTQWEMENCRMVVLTLDVPWNPSQVTIASVAPLSDETLEMRTYRTVCALVNVPRCDEDDCACYSDSLRMNRLACYDVWYLPCMLPLPIVRNLQLHMLELKTDIRESHLKW